jgi:hypothetical protein
MTYTGKPGVAPFSVLVALMSEFAEALGIGKGDHSIAGIVKAATPAWHPYQPKCRRQLPPSRGRTAPTKPTLESES